MHEGLSAETRAPLDHDSPPTETEEQLLMDAQRRFGAIPAAVVVSQVLAIHPDGDFAVQSAALQALIRRMAFAKRDDLCVASRPAQRTVLGVYTTRRKGQRSGARPYTTLLECVSPPRGSCDCPDYTKSSLGLCKHLLVVLESIYASARRLARAEREILPRSARMIWDPTLPLQGPIDRLAGIAWEGQRPAAKLARCFTTEGRIDLTQIRSAKQRHTTLTAMKKSRVEKSPAARAIIEEETARCSRQLTSETALPKALATLRTLKRKLYPYQREGVTEFLRKGRLLLADDMGLGKTTQAVAICHALLGSGRISRGLLVVPASLKQQWLREWRDTSSAPACVIDGAPEERARQYRALSRGFGIIGYEQLLRDFDLVRELAPELVVLDGARRTKTGATKSAPSAKALTPHYRLVLTGTPMENRLEELASLLDWVDDVALAPKWRLVPAYTQLLGDGGRGQAGARNLTTLRQRLAPCVLRRVRKEVLTQLPRRTDTRVPVEMTEAQRLAHDDLDRPIARLVARRHQRPLRQEEFLQLMQLLNKQRMISNGLGQVEFESLWPALATARPNAARLATLFAPKLLELRRLVEDIAVAQERKIVIFSQWRRMLRLAHWSLGDVLGDAGLSARFFTGAERPAQRTRSIVEFHDDPNVRVLLLSDAGGVGLNLQRAGSACINLELPWNPAVLEQRIGRIYRLGQKRPIDVYNLVCDYGIESRISSIVGNKRALFGSVFDGTSDAVSFDGAAPFLEQVERLVDPPAPVVLERDDEDEDDERVWDEDPMSERDVDLDSPKARELPIAESAAGASAAAAGVVPADVANLLANLRVELTPSGSLRIEAPAEVAGALSALLSRMAQLVSAAGASGAKSKA